MLKSDSGSNTCQANQIKSSQFKSTIKATITVECIIMMSPLQLCSQIVSSHEVKSCQIMSNHMMPHTVASCDLHDLTWQLCNQIVSPATTTYINVNGQVRDSLHEERCRFVVKGEFHTSTTHQHFSSCKHPWPLHSCRHPAMQIKSTYMSERVRDCLHEERCRCVVKGEFHTRTHQHLPWTLALMQTLMQIKSSQAKSIKSSQVNQVKSSQKSNQQHRQVLY
jgi:hypothetical protein